MKQLGRLFTPEPVTELLRRLKRKIKTLTATVAAQEGIISQFESDEKPSIHAMELAHDNDVENDAQRRGIMNEHELHRDLEKEYGKTKWAKNLIAGMLYARFRGRKSKEPVR